MTQDQPLHLSGLCCSCPSEHWDEPGPMLPCRSPLGLHKADNTGSCRAPRFVRGEEELLLCGSRISPLLTQLSSTTSTREGTDLSPIQRPGNRLGSEPLAAHCPLGGGVTKEGGPKEGGRKASRDAVGRGGEDAGSQAPNPPFKTSAVSTLCPAVSCKATRVEGRGQHLNHPSSCHAWDGAQL